MCAHKLEAFQRLCWKAFLDSLPEDDITAILQLAWKMNQAFQGDGFQGLVTYDELTNVVKKFEDFVRQSSEAAATFEFWSS